MNAASRSPGAGRLVTKAGNQRHVCGRYYDFLPGSPPVLSPVPGVMVLVTHSELRFAVSEPMIGRDAPPVSGTVHVKTGQLANCHFWFLALSWVWAAIYIEECLLLLCVFHVI